MLIDYHTHHVRCGHAIGELEDYVRKAIDLGFKQLGLSDHMPLLHVDPRTYYPEMAMAMDELPRYVEQCLQLKESYKPYIDIRVGLEGDYIEGFEQQIADIIATYPWDYVIGSVHFLGEWDITDFRQVAEWDTREPIDVYRQYYAAVAKSAKSGMYDFLGHIDAIKRFGFKPADDYCDEVLALEQETLDAIAGSGVAIELNTSGLRATAQEIYPSRRMLEGARRRGIPITIGSDAHHPERLGQFFDQAILLLQDIGYTELATFERRQRSAIAIPAPTGAAEG